jgi:hypothetical protein
MVAEKSMKQSIKTAFHRVLCPVSCVLGLKKRKKVPFEIRDFEVFAFQF